MNTYLKRYQNGFSLIEALIAFVITLGGLLAVASFQAGLFSNSAGNKARTEAVSLAQQKIEVFKHYTHADEENYIDDNDDGVMDADGSYSDDPITGQNAIFLRAWDIATGDDGNRTEVTVSWVDARNETQSVMLAASMPWISPRGGVDQLTELSEPMVGSPTGRAKIGEGSLADYPDAELVPIGSPGVDGLSKYQYEDDLFLVDADDNIVLTLEEACSTDTGVCTEFVTISGTVYLDTANTGQNLIDIYVIASDAAYCQRVVPSGSLSSPPTTASGDYEYYNYTCYLGGGWHGNIGFVTAGGLGLTDKVCQGDPTSLNAWEEPVIAMRRAYRGMLHQDSGGETLYYSHGIKDATDLTGHDYVFTELVVTATDGSYCEGSDAPMTRDDSVNGSLFEGVPVDFFCLNTDADDDSLPDYLDAYDTAEYDADTTCPYDPTDPPVQGHTISGVLDIFSAEELDLSSFEVVTSDGPGNCEFVAPFAATTDGYQASYACTVYNWGTGWSGFVQIRPNSKYIYCPSDTAEFTDMSTDQSHDFGCISSNTVAIKGSISLNVSNGSISSIVITDLLSGYDGVCSWDETSYRCLLPYDGDSVDLTVTVTSTDYVCGANEGMFTFLGYTVDGSPYTHDIVIARNSNQCP